MNDKFMKILANAEGRDRLLVYKDLRRNLFEQLVIKNYKKALILGDGDVGHLLSVHLSVLYLNDTPQKEKLLMTALEYDIFQNLMKKDEDEYQILEDEKFTPVIEIYDIYKVDVLF